LGDDENSWNKEEVKARGKERDETTTHLDSTEKDRRDLPRLQHGDLDVSSSVFAGLSVEPKEGRKKVEGQRRGDEKGREGTRERRRTRFDL